MAQLIEVVNYLTSMNFEHENKTATFFSIVMNWEKSESEKQLVATVHNFEKINQLFTKLAAKEEVEPGSQLQKSMLAALITNRLMNSQVQNLARKCGILWKVDLLSRKSLEALSNCINEAQQFSQLKAGFMVFSDCLYNLISKNTQNLRAVSQFAKDYLKFLLVFAEKINQSKNNQDELLERIFKVFTALASDGASQPSSGISDVFTTMLQDEMKRQQEPTTFDFQLTYWRFVALSAYPSVLVCLEASLRKALTQRFLLLVESSRDFIGYRATVLSMAETLIPAFVPGAKIPVVTGRKKDADEKDVELIGKLSELLRKSLKIDELVSSPKDGATRQPRLSLTPRKRALLSCDCFDKLMLLENRDIIIRNGVKVCLDFAKTRRQK